MTTAKISPAILWLLRIGGAALGAGAGFLVKPLVQWAIDTIGIAPGPLRLAATLPTVWAVPVLAVVGALVGFWLSSMAQKEALKLTVDDAGVRLTQDGTDRYLPRDAVAAVFLDGKYLVFLDAHTRQLARNKASDLSKTELAAAFERLGYPWKGVGDPHEKDFRDWLDGHPDLDEPANRLLQARARALADEEQGKAADLTDRLQATGLVVRDRDGTQQYRRIP